MKITEQILVWVKQQVDSNAVIESIEPLKGSTSSTLYLIKLRMDANNIREVVLRQFTNQKWLKEEPDLALHEASSLKMAVNGGLAAPEIIAYDPGNTYDVPLVLMSKLEGEVNLKAQYMKNWTTALAKELAKIHTVEPDDFQWEYFRYHDIETLNIPSWSTVPDAWRTAIEIIKQPHPHFKQRFIHRDYHPANVLWQNDSIRGVVDWVNACKGPAGIDVGHCRWNLTMLFGEEAADDFLLAYQRLTGNTFTYKVYWDLCSLFDVLSDPMEVYAGWAAFGVSGITNRMMEERMDAYLLSLLDSTERIK